MTGNSDTYREYRVPSEGAVERVRELVREGNVRRLFLKKENGDTIVEIPLSAGVAMTAVGAVFSPALIAVGAVAAMFTSITIGVERPADALPEGSDR